MKKIAVFFIAVNMMLSMQAQKITIDNIPPAVLDGFKAKFSIAEKTTWEIDYDNFQADFAVGKSQFSAKFDKEGKWLETITYLKPSELPKTIKDALAQKYGEILSAYKIEEPMKVEKEKIITYAMEITKGENVYEIIFDDAGELLEDDLKSAVKKD